MSLGIQAPKPGEGSRPRATGCTKEEKVQEILAKYFKSPITIMYGHLPNSKRQPKILKQHARMLMELRAVQHNVSFNQSWMEERLRIVASMKSWPLKEFEVDEFAETGVAKTQNDVQPLSRSMQEKAKGKDGLTHFWR